MPGKVVRQVLGGHAAQPALYPRLELLVVVVGGLDVEGLVGVAVVAGHEVPGLHAQRLVQPQEGRVAVRTDDRLAWLDGVLQGGGHFHPVELGQHLVDGVRLATNPSNQDRHPVRSLAALTLGPTSAVSRWPGELARPLLGLSKIRFIDLQHPRAALGLLGDHALEEPMPPPEGLVYGDAHLGGGGPDGQPLANAIGVRLELLLVPQTAQGRAGRGVEGLGAATAEVSLKPVGHPVADHLLARTVGTGAGLEPVQGPGRGCRRGCRAERGGQLLTLRRREAAQRVEQCFELSGLHPLFPYENGPTLPPYPYLT